MDDLDAIWDNAVVISSEQVAPVVEPKYTGTNSIWIATEENRAKRTRLFLAKVTKLDNGCWIYGGVTGHDGYCMVGYIRSDGKQTTMVAHRWSYLVFVGDIEGS